MFQWPDRHVKIETFLRRRNLLLKKHRRGFRTITALITALVLAMTLLLCGCSGGTNGEEVRSQDGVEITDCGYSMETGDLWAVVHNGTEDTFKQASVDYTLTDAEGNQIWDSINAIEMPYLGPGETRYVADTLYAYDFESDENIDQFDATDKVRIELSTSGVMSKDALKDIKPAAQIVGKNIQVDYREGNEIGFYFDMENDTDYDYEGYHAYYLFKDEDGNYCGGYCEEIDGLKAHESRNYYGYLETFHGADVEVYLSPFTDEE